MLLGQREDDPSQAVLPELKQLTFWNNGKLDNDDILHEYLGGSVRILTTRSLRALSSCQGRLHQLNLKVADYISEQTVIQAIKSIQLGGNLTLGLSQHVTNQTVEKIKFLRPDIHITIKSTQ